MKYPILEGKKVLVTGGAGFIGSNICEALLKSGNKVVCLDNLSTGKRENIQPFLEMENFRFLEGDIRDPATCELAVSGNEYVFHQAALGSVPRSIADPQLTHSVNLTGFLNVIVAARNAKVKKFIYASSSSVYGDHPKLPKVESQLGRPLSPYAITKLTNEHYARTFQDLYGLECVGLRYFNVYGFRQDPDGQYAAVIPRFVKAYIEHRSPTIFGNGDQSRDFTFVEDVVSANMLAASCPSISNVQNAVFNIAAGGRTNLRELTSHLKELLSRYDADISKIDSIFGEPKKGDIPHSLADISHAKALLGYNPQNQIRLGLEKSIQWYWNYFSLRSHSKKE